MSFSALRFLADAETLALSLVQDQVVGEVLDDLFRARAKLLKVEILNALVLRELGSRVFAVANLTHDEHVGAVVLDVVEQLSARHVLVLLAVADVAAKLGAVELGVSLQLAERGPHDLGLAVRSLASVRELAEVNAVLEHLVDLLHEVALGLAVGAANVVLGRRVTLATSTILSGSSIRTDARLMMTATISTSGNHSVVNLLIERAELLLGIQLIEVGVDLLHEIGILMVLSHHLSVAAHKLELAVLAEKLVARFAFLRFVRELEADDALNFLNHLALQLVLNLVKLDVERWDGFGTHELLNSLLSADELEALVDTETFLLGIHLLKDGVHALLLRVHRFDGHFSFRSNQR